MQHRFILIPCSILLASLCSTYACGQNKGYPPIEIKQDTMIFLEFDRLIAEPSFSASTRHRYERNNKLGMKANAELAEAVRGYPFPHMIMKRSEFKKMSGYYLHRWVFDSPLLQRASRGDYMGEGSKEYYVGPLVVTNVATNAHYYIIEEMSGGFTYKYEDLVGFLLKRIKKALADPTLWGKDMVH